MKRIIHNTVLVALLLCFTSSSRAQDIQYLTILEDSIQKYAHLIVNNFQETAQNEANDKLMQFVMRALKQEKSIEHTFDSIPNISFLKSKNKKLRIVTWTVPKIDGSFTFHGVVQSYQKRNKKYIFKELNDQTHRISNPSDKRLGAKKWYGAHYYKLIQKKSRRKATTYTLLGWKGIDQLTKQKVIEVVTLKQNGEVVFGYPMFIVKGFEGEISRRPRRIIFEYSARANMHMEYERHRIITTKKKKAKAKKNKRIGFTAQQKISEEKETKKESVEMMIIFDRLVPSSENMKGIYSYYMPATNVFDGFVYKKNKWVYYPDVDARNHAPAKEKKEIKYELYEENNTDFFSRLKQGK